MKMQTCFGLDVFYIGPGSKSGLTLQFLLPSAVYSQLVPKANVTLSPNPCSNPNPNPNLSPNKSSPTQLGDELTGTP